MDSNEYFNYAKKNLRMFILMAIMTCLCTELYWPKVLRIFPKYDSLEWKILGGFLTYLSLTAIFAAPIHYGKMQKS